MQFYETLTDRSAHLENLFVAVGSGELSNKMMSYTKDQNVFIKTVYFSGGSFVACAVYTMYVQKFTLEGPQ
jgi:pantothenate kinase